MQRKRIALNVDSKLLDHLFVHIPCPECLQKAGVSLEAMHKKRKVTCSNCKKGMIFFPGGDILANFAHAFASFYKQVETIGILPLTFVYDE